MSRYKHTSSKSKPRTTHTPHRARSHSPQNIPPTASKPFKRRFTRLNEVRTAEDTSDADNLDSATDSQQSLQSAAQGVLQDKDEPSLVNFIKHKSSASAPPSSFIAHRPSSSDSYTASRKSKRLLQRRIQSLDSRNSTVSADTLSSGSSTPLAEDSKPTLRSRTPFDEKAISSPAASDLLVTLPPTSSPLSICRAQAQPERRSTRVRKRPRRFSDSHSKIAHANQRAKHDARRRISVTRAATRHPRQQDSSRKNTTVVSVPNLASRQHKVEPRQQPIIRRVSPNVIKPRAPMVNSICQAETASCPQQLTETISWTDDDESSVSLKETIGSSNRGSSKASSRGKRRREASVGSTCAEGAVVTLSPEFRKWWDDYGHISPPRPSHSPIQRAALSFAHQADSEASSAYPNNWADEYSSWSTSDGSESSQSSSPSLPSASATTDVEVLGMVSIELSSHMRGRLLSDVSAGAAASSESLQAPHQGLGIFVGPNDILQKPCENQSLSKVIHDSSMAPSQDLNLHVGMAQMPDLPPHIFDDLQRPLRPRHGYEVDAGPAESGPSLRDKLRDRFWDDPVEVDEGTASGDSVSESGFSDRYHVGESRVTHWLRAMQGHVSDDTSSHDQTLPFTMSDHLWGPPPGSEAEVEDIGERTSCNSQDEVSDLGVDTPGEGSAQQTKSGRQPPSDAQCRVQAIHSRHEQVHQADYLPNSPRPRGTRGGRGRDRGRGRGRGQAGYQPPELRYGHNMGNTSGSLPSRRGTSLPPRPDTSLQSTHDRRLDRSNWRPLGNNNDSKSGRLGSTLKNAWD
ncbi:unnamed protein product [Sympodiomycopsis kandeliae]